VGIGLNLLRVIILGYFAALFGLALWVAFHVLAAAAENPDCAVRHCKRYERAGDWMSALNGEVLFSASVSFTGVVFVGMVVFAIPWLIYLWVLKRTGRLAPPPQ
jgi:hypothetical protein